MSRSNLFFYGRICCAVLLPAGFWLSGCSVSSSVEITSTPLVMETCAEPESTPGLLVAGTPAVALPAPQAVAKASTVDDSSRPARTIHDPYPVFAGLAVDPINNKVVVADQNTYHLFIYDRSVEAKGLVKPTNAVGGENARMLFIAGVDVDPEHQEMYTVNNDIMDNMVVFSYAQDGNVSPVRELSVDHGSWGVSVDKENGEVAVTTQHIAKISIYRRGASGKERPLRIIQGPNTGLADPHGIVIDTKNNEIVVSNHGSWHRVATGGRDLDEERGRAVTAMPPPNLSTGKYEPPSVKFYARTAKDDAVPIRVIQGDKTQMNLPLSIFVDTVHDEVVVANDGGDSILFFDRKANGNVAPLRSIKGAKTGLKNPAGVGVDVVHNQIWVSNWGNRTITVYPRDAKGNAAPLKTLTAAPPGEPMAGLGNAGAVAYDPLREELLVPN